MRPYSSNLSSDSKKSFKRMRRKERRKWERMLTTQKVSHPPVKPKYGAFAPARRARCFLKTDMAPGVMRLSR